MQNKYHNFPLDSFDTAAPLEYSLVDSKSEKGLISCSLCNSIISDVFTGFETGQTDEEISAGIAQRCETLNLYNYKVCYGTAFIAMVSRCETSIFIL